MSSYDGPLEDYRLPAHGSGPSFGMLGPTRVLVALDADEWSLPAPTNQRVLLSMGEQSSAFPWQWAWQGNFADLSAQLLLTCVDLPDREWAIQLAVLSVSGTEFDWFGVSIVLNFEWQFPQINIPDAFGSGNSAVFRVGEWQQISERFPLAAFPEDV